MPRPRKPRQCQCTCLGQAFKPAGVPLMELERLTLAGDELEALRLCDLLGLTQAQAGARMGVSRATVQRIVTSARQKVARALVEGAALMLSPSGEPGGIGGIGEQKPRHE
ncbi:MAG: DUF134 domain-containing protein [Pseudomonadota bacterium]